MTIKHSVGEVEKENVVDDLSDAGGDQAEDKMAKLRAKLAQSLQSKDEVKDEVKEGKMGKREKSLKIGICGNGQAGGKIAREFYAKGYDAIIFNTNAGDLANIDIPESNKILLQFGIGGSSKDISIGRAAAESNYEQIKNSIEKQLSDVQMFILTASLGGGTGSGGMEVFVDILNEIGKPIVLMCALPMHSEDPQCKSNALTTLSKLSKLLQEKKVQNILVIDNARIESIYHNVSQMNFFEIANRAAVEPIDIFNTLSSAPSHIKPLDPSEFAKILIDGNGFSSYGSITVDKYEEDTALASAAIDNLNSNLLASSFDLKQSRYIGVIVEANESVWEKIPASSVNYMLSIINDMCGTPLGVFKGIYVTDIKENIVKIHSFFSGMGAPLARVEELKAETKELMNVVKQKDEQRSLVINVDSGTNNTVSDVQRIKDKIANKSSSFGKLMSSNVVDRRKK